MYEDRCICTAANSSITSPCRGPYKVIGMLGDCFYSIYVNGRSATAPTNLLMGRDSDVDNYRRLQRNNIARGPLPNQKIYFPNCFRVGQSLEGVGNVNN